MQKLVHWRFGQYFYVLQHLSEGLPGLVVDDYLELLNAVLSGQYELVLSHPLSRQILNLKIEGKEEPGAIITQIEENVKCFLSCHSEDEAVLRSDRLLICTLTYL